MGVPVLEKANTHTDTNTRGSGVDWSLTTSYLVTQIFKVTSWGPFKLERGKAINQRTRDVNCSNCFCLCLEKLHRGVSAELLEPSEKKVNLTDRFLFSFY